MDDFNLNMNLGDGVQKVGKNGRGLRPFYYRLPEKKNNPKLRNFRLGEIIQGRILTIEDVGIGEVRLPNGVFKCNLHPGLLPNDELFFRIAEVEPSLVLKVYSVQTKINRIKRKKEDIIRILDLPDNELYQHTAELFLTFKTMIYKDDLIKFYKFYGKLSDIDNYDAESCSRALFWMAESGLHFEYDIFEVAYGYFNTLKYIDSIMGDFLHLNPKLLPDAVNKLLSNFRSGFDSDNTEVKFDFFSQYTDKEVFSLSKFVSKLSVSILSARMQQLPNKIDAFIQNMHIWNNICVGSDSAYHWSFPLKLDNKVKIVTLVIKSQFKISEKEKSSNSVKDIDIGEVLKMLIGISSEELSESVESDNSLNMFVNTMAKFINDIGLTLMAVMYFDGELRTVESPYGAAISANKSISFVI